MRRFRTGGFTLVELMVTIVILAIVMAIAFPNFAGLLRSNRVATATNELVASLALARSEALRSPGGAGICTTTNGSDCNGTSWNDGWMVWIDFDGNGLETGDDDRVIRYTQGRENLVIGIAASGGASEANKVLFDRRGRIVGSRRNLSIQPDVCPAGQVLRREVDVRRTGQVAITHGDCQ